MFHKMTIFWLNLKACLARMLLVRFNTGHSNRIIMEITIRMATISTTMAVVVAITTTIEDMTMTTDTNKTDIAIRTKAMAITIMDKASTAAAVVEEEATTTSHTVATIIKIINTIRITISNNSGTTSKISSTIRAAADIIKTKATGTIITIKAMAVEVITRIIIAINEHEWWFGEYTSE